MTTQALDFHLAEPGELKEIFALFCAAIAEMEKDGIPQWDEVYPDEQTLRLDIERKQLYAATQKGHIAAVFVLNDEFDPQYANGVWEVADRYLILHRLCVHPTFQHGGMGKKTVQAAEQQAKQLGAKAIRLDAFKQNPYALRLYEKMGYRIAGDALFRKGPFYLMEKKLD